MKRILIIRGGAIGDFIVTLPAIAALRSTWPEARIELLGYPAIAELACGRGYLDEVRPVDTGPLASYFVPNTILDPDLMEYFGSFDLIVSYFFDPDGFFTGNLRKSCPEGKVIYQSPVVVGHSEPASEYYLRAVSDLVDELPSSVPKLYPSAADQQQAKEFGCRAGLGEADRLVAVHPGSGGQSKCWPLERWLELLPEFAVQDNCRLMVVSGEVEADRLPLLRQRWPESNRFPVYADGLDLPVLAALFQRCHCFIGNDSGPMHMAAAVGTPTIALFGPTNEKVWAPPGENVRVLRGGDSMGDLSVQTVRDALKQFVN